MSFHHSRPRILSVAEVSVAGLTMILRAHRENGITFSLRRPEASGGAAMCSGHISMGFPAQAYAIADAVDAKCDAVLPLEHVEVSLSRGELSLRAAFGPHARPVWYSAKVDSGVASDFRRIGGKGALFLREYKVGRCRHAS